MGLRILLHGEEVFFRPLGEGAALSLFITDAEHLRGYVGPEISYGPEGASHVEIRIEDPSCPQEAHSHTEETGRGEDGG